MRDKNIALLAFLGHPPARTETCGVQVTESKHTSAQEDPRQGHHRRLSAPQ